MASVQKSKRRSLDSTSTDEYLKERARNRLHWRLWFVPILLLLLVWAAPMIVAKVSPFRQMVLNSAAASLDGSLTARDASFGWFSPIVLYDLELHDAEGQLVALLPKVQGNTSLLSLASDMQSLGTFTIDRAELHVVLDEHSSNLEKVLAPLLEAEPDPNAQGVDLRITAQEMWIEIKDLPTHKTWDLADGELALELRRDSTLPTEVLWQAQPKNIPGSSPIKFSMEQIAATGSTAQGNAAQDNAAQGSAAQPLAIEASTQGLPLEMLDAARRRFLPEMQFSGQLSTQLTAEIQPEDFTQGKVSGEISIANLDLSGDLLQGDRLQLAQLRMPADLLLQGQVVQVNQLQVISDLGTASLKGELPLEFESALAYFNALLRKNLQLEGQIDVARLAGSLPKTLSIRPDIKVTSGLLQWNLNSQQTTAGPQWSGNLNTSALVAEHAGQLVRWEQPISVVFAAREAANQAPAVDNLQVNASFLNLQAAGSLQEFSALGSFDLGRLKGELSQFIDLGQIELAGLGNFDVRCATNQITRAFEVNGAGQVNQLRVVQPNKRSWNEEMLHFVFNGTGVFGQQSIETLNWGSFQLVSSTDRCEIRLLQPTTVAATSVWPLELRLYGDLTRWQNRLRPLVEFDDLQVAGVADIFTQVNYAPEIIDVALAKAHISGFKFFGSGLFVDEPVVEMEAAGRWDQKQSQLLLGKSTLATSSLSLGTDAFVFHLPAEGAANINGTVDFRGAAAGLYRWTIDPRTQANWRPTGDITGRAVVTQSSAVTTANLNMGVDRFALFPAAANSQAVWEEPQIRLSGNLRYDRNQDTVQFESLDLQSKMLRILTTGSIAELSARRLAAITGEMEYDLATISKIMQPYTNSQIMFTGQDRRKFAVNGPLSGEIKDLTAQASAGWQSGSVYGVPLGAGALNMQLQQGIMFLGPVDMMVSQGRLTAAPQIRLTQSPIDVVMDKGPVLQQVRLTVDMCEQGLKFVAPVVSEATRIDGTVSLALSQPSRFPIEEPLAGEGTGVLTVHALQVMPGPLTERLVGAARQIEALLQRRSPTNQPATLLSMEQQQVNFQFAQRRVYHQNLSFKAGNMTIRTSGSVGLDQSLSLVAEIPVLEEWTAREPLLAGMRGQVIQIPISGTLQRPQLDARVFEQLSQQILQSTAGSVIRDGLNQGLDRLFNRN